MTAPSRGDIWQVDLGRTRGREQAGTRPALVVSVDPFNQSGADLVILLPITSKFKRVRSHVPVQPPEGGLSLPSFIKCEDVRSVSKQRLLHRLGTVSSATIAHVEDCLRILLGL
jgi:mRNA interferase MazF